MEKFSPLRYVQCEVCKDKKGPLGQAGFYYVVDTNGHKKVVECACHKKWIKDNIIYIQAANNNILSSEFNQRYSLDKYIGTNSTTTLNNIRKYLNVYPVGINKSYVIYIHGDNNSQKTTVAQYIGLSIFRLGYTAYYTRMKEFNDNVCMASFSASEETIKKREDFIKKVEKVDCLIIDDAFDKDKAGVYTTGSQSPYIEGFLRDRIEGQQKGVIFVSRVKLDKIEANGYSESLQSFVNKCISKYKSYLPLLDVINENKLSVGFNVNSMFEVDNG